MDTAANFLAHLKRRNQIYGLVVVALTKSTGEGEPTIITIVIIIRW